MVMSTVVQVYVGLCVCPCSLKKGGSSCKGVNLYFLASMSYVGLNFVSVYVVFESLLVCEWFFERVLMHVVELRLPR